LRGDGATVIGVVAPNPAIMNNRCHTVLVRNCRPRHPVDFDHTEDLITHLVPLPGHSQAGRGGYPAALTRGRGLVPFRALAADRGGPPGRTAFRRRVGENPIFNSSSARDPNGARHSALGTAFALAGVAVR
jgi:hypothetical protein